MSIPTQAHNQKGTRGLLPTSLCHHLPHHPPHLPHDRNSLRGEETWVPDVIVDNRVKHLLLILPREWRLLLGCMGMWGCMGVIVRSEGRCVRGVRVCGGVGL